jgi:5-hydroxyisourate hydrolase-like protein (transthyretin family)
MNPLRPAAVIGAVALAGLGVTPALAATAPKPTSLTLKAAHSSVAPKTKDTLTATLKSGTKPVAGEPVKLEKRAAGAKSWTLVSSKTTNAKGQTSWSVVPGSKKGQKEQYELVFSGNKSYKASHSSVITVTVS